MEFTNAECLGTLTLQKEVIKQLSLYKPVRDNRKIPHISSQVISPKILSVANLSCYECDECLFDDNTKCTNSDYYLMKVSKVPFQLERVENDDWGNTFPVGANVAGVIIITEGNKIHLNMNLFEEG